MPTRKPRRLFVAAFALALAGSPAPLVEAGQGGMLRLEVVDRDTRQPVACRMHLTNSAQRSLKAPKAPFWHDHFVFDGQIALKLPEGEYAFEIERGPEYLVRYGRFTMQNFSDDQKVVDVKRFVDMAAEGWWSGDLDVVRPAKDLELLMRAEDLHVVELATWPHRKGQLPKTGAPKGPLVEFDGNRYLHLGAGTDDRAGGTLLLFHLEQPLDLSQAKAEFPPLVASLRATKSQQGAWVDAASAYGWDLPLLVASGQLDSVQLAPSSLGRKLTAEKQDGGRPRNSRLYPGGTGVGRWSEDIYYHLLNCGLRIVPTAGSGSGRVANPLGYNRLYVHVDGELTYEKWWQSLDAGRVVVTNGPLIRPNVEGELPGHVFQANLGEQIELEVGLTLSTRDPISYLEIIKNGQSVHQVRLSEWEQTGGKLPPVVFEQSGWFLIRAATDVAETYRFASSGPYYVEFADRPRISKASAQFFLDWLDERTAMVTNKLDDAAQRETVLKEHRQARQFWQDLVERANVE